MDKQGIAAWYDRFAEARPAWAKKARFYHRDLASLLRRIVPRRARVVEVGCGTGDLLAALEPAAGLGLDLSPKMIEVARGRHPGLRFAVDDLHRLGTEEKFDYVILSNLVGMLDDVQTALGEVHRIAAPGARIVIVYYSRLWQPALRLAELLGLKMPQPEQNWLAAADIENLLELSDFDVVTSGMRMLLPFYVPLLSTLLNRALAPLPGIRHLCLTSYFVARPRPRARTDLTVSVIIPTKNEAGNVFGAVERTPAMGAKTELLFVDGHSEDGTVEKIREAQEKYPELDIQLMMQSGQGKGNAVFEAMDRASGDVLMILDSDLTMPPEELPKFFEVFASGRGEFLNGCRLVYPMESGAMRFLNMVANHTFAVIFSWLLGFRVKDTLCGTKVLSKEAYRVIRRHMDYFGDFDPFGDFQLILGAARFCLKFRDVPVHYRARTYGDIEIRRFRDGLLLARTVFLAMRKLKFV